MQLSKKQARRAALARQGLLKKNAFGTGKSATLKAIEHMGYLQLDTISVVQRSHHHVMWTRTPSYKPEYLDQLQNSDRKIFEYWSHAAAYLPIKHYRYCLPRMKAIAGGERHWYAPDRKMMRFCLDRISAEGPLMARDFKPPKGFKRGPWWNWKPAKKALEHLFMEGKLMVAKRVGFQKVYDLTERVLPESIDRSMPTDAELAGFLISEAIKSNGIVSESQIGYLRKGVGDKISKQLKEMLKNGEVVVVSIEGCATPYHSAPDILSTLQKLRVSKHVRLLSPFENAIIQRQRTRQLFDFDYQLECYVPVAKRKFGYFCLPILWGDELVGRLDPKADRASKTLRVKSLYLEKKIRELDRFSAEIAMTLEQLAVFNNCDRIAVEDTQPKHLKDLLLKVDQLRNAFFCSA